MSDKNTYKKDLVDQGWKNMSSILKKEMPVKKKKRRFFFWIFFMGIIVLGAVVGLNLPSIHSTDIASVEIRNTPLNGIGKHSEQQTDIDFTTESNLIENKSIIEKEITKNNIIEKREISKEVDFVKKENYNAIKNYNLNYDIQTLKNNEVARHLFFNENTDEKETIIIDIKKEDSGLLETKVFENKLKIIPGKSNEKILIKEEIKQREEVNVVKPIAFSDTDYIEFSEKETLPFNPKFSQWKFGVETGFVFQNKNELGGKLGFVASKEFRPKWMFHTGLEYNVQFVNYSIMEQEYLNMDVSLGSGLNPIPGELESLQSNPIKINSHFMKIPVLVGYKFNRSFELTAGILGSSVIYSGEGKRNTNLDEVFFDPQEYNNTGFKKITPIFDIQTSIGMTYYPNKKWGINIRYDNGYLQRKIKYKGSSASGLIIKGYNSRNRQLSLSARMYF